MPTGDGFTADITELEKAANWPNGSLPRTITRMRDPLTTLWLHEGFGGRGKLHAEFASARGVETIYKSYCETLANLQNEACSALDAVAEALREIADLYRRVDGRA
jgi:hypothetical protein